MTIFSHAALHSLFPSYSDEDQEIVSQVDAGGGSKITNAVFHFADGSKFNIL